MILFSYELNTDANTRLYTLCTEDSSMTYFLNAVFTRRRAIGEEGAIVGASSYAPKCEET